MHTQEHLLDFIFAKRGPSHHSILGTAQLCITSLKKLNFRPGVY